MHTKPALIVCIKLNAIHTKHLAKKKTHKEHITKQIMQSRYQLI